jgi:hypothetical protein
MINCDNFFVSKFSDVIMRLVCLVLLLSYSVASYPVNDDITMSVSTTESHDGSIGSSIMGFLRMLFGDNVPGQPAMPQAGLAVSSRDRKSEKAFLIFSLAALLVLCVRFVKSYRIKHSSQQEYDYYRNIQGLEENFL